MGREIIGLGAPTSTGGKVLEGNIGINIGSSVNTASVGHRASCPACIKGTGPIVAVGPRTIYLPAGLVALEGDYVACGCPPFSNSVMAGQSTVLGGAEHTAASFTQIIDLLVPKLIKSIYFTYGADALPLDAVSRFYVDLNIHIVTSGYAVGEVVSVSLSGDVERSMAGVVGDDGIAVISDAFVSDRIELKGEL